MESLNGYMGKSVDYRKSTEKRQPHRTRLVDYIVATYDKELSKIVLQTLQESTMFQRALTRSFECLNKRLDCGL
jgi:hypothetical protein